MTKESQLSVMLSCLDQGDAHLRASMEEMPNDVLAVMPELFAANPTGDLLAFARCCVGSWVAHELYRRNASTSETEEQP